VGEKRGESSQLLKARSWERGAGSRELRAGEQRARNRDKGGGSWKTRGVLVIDYLSSVIRRARSKKPIPETLIRKWDI